MTEYIEKQAAITIPVMPKRYRKYQTMNLDDVYEDGWDDAQKCIGKIRPADVRPVVRGCWVFNEEDGHCYCSECGGVSPMDDQNGDECDCPNYCPNCGADMRGENDG